MTQDKSTKIISAYKLNTGDVVIGWGATDSFACGTMSKPSKATAVSVDSEAGLVRVEFGKNVLGACYQVTDEILIQA